MVLPAECSMSHVTKVGQNCSHTPHMTVCLEDVLSEAEY